MQKATLCILIRRKPVRQVLLGFKKTGFGQGKYTGFGGKVNPGETVLAAARRELAEETSILVPIEGLCFAGKLTFLFPNRPNWNQEVHVFRVENWQGEPHESEEMKPEWFLDDTLPYQQMWDDGHYWLPPILEGKMYSARFTFQDDNSTVKKVDVESTAKPKPESFSLESLLTSTLAARDDLLMTDPDHETAFRLLNGFLEGCPALAVDLYADTLVIQNHADTVNLGEPFVTEAQSYYLDNLPWLKTVVVKTRSKTVREGIKKSGEITFGNTPAKKIREYGVWYAIDLQLHQDGTFYPDTRNLRRWAIEHLSTKRALNTFAYTGSLGVAALAGGAKQVLQLDRNRAYLSLAASSYTLNGFNIQRSDFLAGDFFPHISALKRQRALFDCVFLDPPYFSVTNKGKVDLISQNIRLINKVRPLISDGGWLISVNNALFVSGSDYLQMLESICKEGYLSIEQLIPIPPDCSGYPETKINSLPTDPAPFNHATKIAVLRIRRKDKL